MMQSISREQIVKNLEQRRDMAIVEALPQRFFDSGHLPGAINIPHDEIEQKAAALLPDKAQFIVVYCSNKSCGNSTIAVERLQQMGYTNVHKFAEGKENWMEARLPLEN